MQYISFWSVEGSLKIIFLFMACSKTRKLVLVMECGGDSPAGADIRRWVFCYTGAEHRQIIEFIYLKTFRTTMTDAFRGLRDVGFFMGTSKAVTYFKLYFSQAKIDPEEEALTLLVRKFAAYK